MTLQSLTSAEIFDEREIAAATIVARVERGTFIRRHGDAPR